MRHLSDADLAALLDLDRAFWRDNKRDGAWAAAQGSAEAIDDLLDEANRRALDNDKEPPASG